MAHPGVLVATNYQEFVRPIQVLVIAVIFVFFLRVIRAVMVESRPPVREKRQRADRAAAKQQKRQAAKWLYLEIKFPEDAAGERFPIAGELTVGRSATCDINLGYDQYASTKHARFYRTETDESVVEDLGSTNGVWVEEKRIVAPTVLRRGDKVQIGETQFVVTK